MADLQKTIEIIFGGTDNFSGVAKDIDKSISGISGSVETATQPLADLAANILKVETAIAALGIATLFYAQNQAAELSDAQSGLQKVLSDSEGSADQYADAIKRLSLEYGVAGEATTSTVADFKQAGFSIEESLGLIDVALTGVKIAELSAEESGALLIKNIRGIGAEADDASHFMDAWNEVSNNYAVTAKELAIATAALAPIAKTAGLSFDELVGLVTPMIEVLGSGSEAANTLKVSLANLISDNKRVTEALGELGIAQRDVNSDLRSSSDILDDLGKLWPTLSESQQANFGIQLFGKEQYSKMSIVLNDYEKVLSVTTAAEGAAGSAKEELAIALDKAGTASARFVVAFNLAAAAIGGEFLDSSNNVTSSLTDLAISFIDVIEGGGLKPLFDLLNPLLDEFSNNIDLIAKNLPAAFDGVDFSGLIKSFKDIGFEFGEIFGDIDFKSAEGLQDVIQKIIDLLTVLNDVFAGVIEGFAPIIEAFLSMANAAADSDSETANLVGNIIGYGATFNTFSGWLNGLLDIFGNLAEAVVLLAGAKALGLLPDSFGKVGTAAGGLGKILGKAGLVGAVGALGFELGTVIGETEPVRDFFGSIFDGIDKLVGGPLSKAATQMSDYAKATEDVVTASEKEVKAIGDVSDAHKEAYDNADKYDDIVNDLAKSTEDAEVEARALAKGEEDLAAQMEKMGLAADGSTKKVEDSATATKDAKVEQEGYNKEIKDGVVTYEQAGKAQGQLSKDIGKVKDATNDAAESAAKAEAAAKKMALEYAKLEVELEGIASNERIKSMEFFVDLEIAKVEADAQKVVAAFESVTDAYVSSTELIGSLYGELGGEGLSRFQEIDLEKSIKEAEKLARDQWETQKKLIEAQIDQIEAATERTQRGDALIKVDGGELQPELEAIMQSLFRSIRVKMSADYENFLFGLQ